jgi:acetyltransferase
MLYRIHRYPTDLIDVMRLPDGRRITIRPVLPQDAGLLQAFVRDLSPRSRRYRFFQGLRELPPAMLECLTRIDYSKQMALLGEVFGSNGETMVCEARYAVGQDPATAEFAIATADAWQGNGIARTMLALLERCAAASGIGRLVGETLSDNARLLRLARRVGFQVRRDAEFAGLLHLEKATDAACG